jgi:GTPase
VKFLDEVTIEVRSGRGGGGMVHFHRARHLPRGGPDGGDGGAGGDVVLRAQRGCNTLLHLRYNPHHRAGHGVNGGTNNRTGKRGESLTIRVPVGTIVRIEGDSAPIADLTADGQSVVVAQGGRGGRGNAVFKTSTNRTPLKADEGGPCTELRLELELRLLADVGLVGLPNAGKSTLVSRISAARPRIADYPFTTLEPSLGMVKHGEFESFVVADLPGLIEGAHEGHGLGHRFLRHVERTAVLLYVVSLEPDLPAPMERLGVLQDELSAYRDELGQRTALVGLSKRDLMPDDREVERLVRQLEESTSCPVIPFSSVSGHGIPALVHALGIAVRDARAEEDG